MFQDEWETMTCPDCEGKGSCPFCSSTGKVYQRKPKIVHYVQTTRDITVTINEGSLNGLTLCLRGNSAGFWSDCGCEEDLAPLIVKNWQNEPFDVKCPVCGYTYQIVPRHVLLEYDREEIGYEN